MSNFDEEAFRRQFPSTWGMSETPAQKAAREKEAAEKEAARVEKFLNSLDKDLEKHLGIPPRSEEQKARDGKGVSMEKSEQARQAYTGRVPYDSVARREAIAAHLESMGVSKELQEVRKILDLGNGAPVGYIPPDRRDPNSPGGRMRGDDGRERGDQGRERD